MSASTDPTRARLDATQAVLADALALRERLRGALEGVPPEALPPVVLARVLVYEFTADEMVTRARALERRLQAELALVDDVGVDPRHDPAAARDEIAKHFRLRRLVSATSGPAPSRAISTGAGPMSNPQTFAFPPGVNILFTADGSVFKNSSGTVITVDAQQIDPSALTRAGFTPVLSGATAQRPNSGTYAGMHWLDTTLGKPIFRNAANSGWVDATGAAV